MVEKIIVEIVINVPIEKAWRYWNEPEHITKWAFASDDWHAPYADNDLIVGGKFKTSMAAKDGSFSFDFEGLYTNVVEHRLIEYSIPDGRAVKIVFAEDEMGTKITETFDAENTHPIDMQRNGWQAILANFKKYTERN